MAKMTAEKKFFRRFNRVDPELAKHVWKTATRAIDLGVDQVIPEELHAMLRFACSAVIAGWSEGFAKEGAR